MKGESRTKKGWNYFERIEQETIWGENLVSVLCDSNGDLTLGMLGGISYKTTLANKMKQMKSAKLPLHKF